MTLDLWDRSSAPAAEPVEPAHVAESAAGTTEAPESWRGGRHRRRRWLLVVGLAVVVVLVALLFVTTGPGPTSTAPLDPRNPTATGAQALARVLEAQGVRVEVARGEAELARSTLDSDTTVFVSRASELAPSTTRELARLTRGTDRLVLLSPSRPVLRELGPSIGVTQVRRSERDLVATGCANGDIRDGETLSRTDSEFQAPGALAACFTTGSSSAYVVMPRTSRAPRLVLLGSTSALTNDQVTQAGNAAIALRMLGHSGRLVWYVPSRLDVPNDGSATPNLVPAWVGPSMALGAVAFLGVILWRGRRFGRLVAEPLPVVVRAVETTESRGRLYRRAGDATRAGSVLQQATRNRLATFLGLPRPHPSADHALVEAVAAASGRRLDDVGGLLYGPPPTRDDHLLGLAVELADLEKDVRRS